MGILLMVVGTVTSGTEGSSGLHPFFRRQSICDMLKWTRPFLKQPKVRPEPPPPSLQMQQVHITCFFWWVLYSWTPMSLSRDINRVASMRWQTRLRSSPSALSDFASKSAERLLVASLSTINLNEQLFAFISQLLILGFWVAKEMNRVPTTRPLLIGWAFGWGFDILMSMQRGEQ